MPFLPVMEPAHPDPLLLRGSGRQTGSGCGDVQRSFLTIFQPVIIGLIRFSRFQTR